MCFSDTPLLENTKVIEFPFRVFDRYEINIQYFEELFTGFFLIFSKFQLFEISKFLTLNF